MTLSKATTDAENIQVMTPAVSKWTNWRLQVADVLGGVCHAFTSDSDHLAKRLKDYTAGGRQLFWQRQGMFLGATLLAWYYFNPKIAILSYILILLAETYDSWLGRRIMNWQGNDRATARKFLRLIILGTVFSAFSVSLFAVLIARFEGAGDHFTSLFLLFAAALFAAMYNHQLIGVLVLRLVIYGAAFIYIPIRDLWLDSPSVSSPLSLQIIVVLFVLYFVIDCSVVFLRLYQNNLRQLEQLRVEHEKTKAAYEAKKQFLSVVSHELRTPLTSLVGGIGILENGALGPIPEKARPVLEIARKNGERLQSLVNDLLDLQKMESGKMHFEKSRFDLGDLVRETVDACVGFGDMNHIRYCYSPIPEPAMILGDRNRTSQVLVNILSNAAKFSQEGGTVDIAILVKDRVTRVEVTDHGCGIPDGMGDKVFGRFTQIDSTDQRKFGGSGLGMSISRRIMNELGGRIDYHSRLGQGTTFFIELETCPL
jgi:signal transduction histidine kinase